MKNGHTLLWLGAACALQSLLAGCASPPAYIPTSGPSREQVVEQPANAAPIPVVDIDDALARRVGAVIKHNRFGDVFGAGRVAGNLVGPGDVVEVSIWEAPPATLFGTAATDARGGTGTSRVTTFPEQMVTAEGKINVPFAGTVDAADKSPQQIESDIVRRLAGKANQPQVMVRVTRNSTSTVTVVGEVAQSVRVPLTARGERLLDALAVTGGMRQPVGKITIQLSRGERVESMPLDAIIQDPKQNILLQPGDVVTALFQPNSFTALGASNKNEEINFEAQGITLAQALGRIGGLQDTRADAMGVFVFRFEDPASFPDAGKDLPRTAEGKVPVVYRADLKNPATFLVAQNFPVRNKDVVYIANAPAAELQKFLNILTSSIFSVSSLVTLGR